MRIGPEASVWPNCTLRADEGEIVIGAQSNVQDGTTIHMFGGRSNTYIGERVTVGHNCILHGCLIADEVLIGMGSLLMDNCSVGAGSYIGAGTMITADKVIPPRSLAYGWPFHVRRPTNDAERDWIERGWRTYLQRASEYRAAHAAR